MSRAMQRICTILFLLTPWLAAGADQPLTLPDWLATLQEANSITRTASAASVDLAYLVPLSPAEVTSRYQQQLQKAGVRFRISFDGIGNTLSASTESISCIVHIAKADGGSRVRVGCAPEIAQPSSQVIVPGIQFPAVAAIRGQAPPTQPTGLIAIEGWSQALWGMTEKEVLAAFPGEAKILTDDPMNRQYASGLAPVGIDHADIGGIPVRVLFLFDSADKLRAIRFVANSATPFPPPAYSDDQFMRIENALERIYGPPTLRTASTARYIISATLTGSASFLSAWVLPHSLIEISYIPTGVLGVSIDVGGKQTAASILARHPGFIEVHGPHQLWGLLK